MNKKFILLPLICATLCAAGQSIRITPYAAPTALYFDAGHLYNYNIYEGSRIEAGLQWVVPSETANIQRRMIGQWTFGGYAAYGFRDHGIKAGLSTQLRIARHGDTKLRLQVYKDLERAASRNLGSYNVLLPQYNPSFLASRYVGVKGGSLQIVSNARRLWQYNLGMRLTWEDYRFDNSDMIYPPTPLGDGSSPLCRHTEISARADWNKCFTLLLTGGLAHQTDGNQLSYLRAIGQYSAEPGKLGLHIFAQAGYTTPGSPYSRMFDLSGTSNAIYYFRNSFLTVRPNTFTSHFFAHLCLNYTAPMPLWKLDWSQPQPFLQFNAMWGRLHNQDANGCLTQEGLPLQAPYMGLYEPATGFDGLIRIGWLDFGVCMAYQLCPASAPYRLTDPIEGINFTIVATMIFDKQ